MGGFSWLTGAAKSLRLFLFIVQLKKSNKGLLWQQKQTQKQLDKRFLQATGRLFRVLRLMA
jgi:hypothetical protein